MAKHILDTLGFHGTTCKKPASFTDLHVLFELAREKTNTPEQYRKMCNEIRANADLFGVATQSELFDTIRDTDCTLATVSKMAHSVSSDQVGWIVMMLSTRKPPGENFELEAYFGDMEHAVLYPRLAHAVVAIFAEVHKEEPHMDFTELCDWTVDLTPDEMMIASVFHDRTFTILRCMIVYGGDELYSRELRHRAIAHYINSLDDMIASEHNIDGTEEPREMFDRWGLFHYEMVSDLSMLLLGEAMDGDGVQAFTHRFVEQAEQ